MPNVFKKENFNLLGIRLPVEDAYMGFTYITLRGIAPVIRNQWGNRIRHFKVLGLLRKY